MADVFHKDIQLDDIHQITNWIWPTVTERNAEVITASDLFKVGYQQSNETFYILVNTTPTWKQLLVEGGSATPTGPAGGALTGIYPDPGIANDSHNHTPGITIPAYPTTLPPDGPAGGGDLTGTYPNPTLSTTGITAGTYNRATITVDNKGRIFGVAANTDPPPPAGLPFPGFANAPLTGNATAPTTPYEEDSTRIATTAYVTRGNITYPVLEEGEQLTILPGYQKVVHGYYSLEDNHLTAPTTILIIRGTLVIMDEDGGSSNGAEPMFTPRPNNNIAPQDVQVLTIPMDYFKIVPSGFFVQTPIEILGTLLVI